MSSPDVTKLNVQILMGGRDWPASSTLMCANGLHGLREHSIRVCSPVHCVVDQIPQGHCDVSCLHAG